MKVVVDRCSSPQYWYANLIGSKFDFIDQTRPTPELPAMYRVRHATIALAYVDVADGHLDTE